METDGSAEDFLLSAQPSIGTTSDASDTLTECSSLELELLSSSGSACSAGSGLSEQGETQSVSLLVRCPALFSSVPRVATRPQQRRAQVCAHTTSTKGIHINSYACDGSKHNRWIVCVRATCLHMFDAGPFPEGPVPGAQGCYHHSAP